MTMPTTRMEIILDLANQAVTKAESGRKLLEAINNDINSLRREIDKLNIENEYIQDLMFSIANLAWDASKICTVPADLAQELGAERERLKLNANKNKNSRERMRRKRAKGRGEIGEQREQTPREERITGEEITKRLVKARQTEADIAAAKEAIAEGEVEGFTSLEELKKEFGFEEETPHSHTPAVDPNSLAARSEQIPLENDEESWLPKKK